MPIKPAPAISVIIPLYNKEGHVRRALQSVLAQTALPVEIIVVDDGSTDQGTARVEAVGSGLIRLIRQKNAGVSAARNRGVSEAEGDYVAFLDADDEWLPGHLALLGELIRIFPDAGVYATNYRVQTPDGTQRPARIRGIPGTGGSVLFHDFFGPASDGELPLRISSTCIARSLFQQAGGFPEGESMGEDQDLVARLCLHRPFAFHWDTGSIYHEDSENRAMDRIVPSDELPFCVRLREYLAKGRVPEKLVPSIRKYLTAQFVYVAVLNVKGRKYRNALRLLRDPRGGGLSGRKALWMLRALSGLLFRSKPHRP